MNIIKEKSRGSEDYGWLKTNYSFSFANYYNENRMRFGPLRVLNHDKITPKSGFPMHPHSNMEIVTIILKGKITHKDSMGNVGNISEGEIQSMSAGTGVFHSEFNLEDKELELFQIWIEPKLKNIKPKYEETKFNLKLNQLTILISSDEKDKALAINQDVKFIMGEYESNKEINFKLEKEEGVYLQLIEGIIEVNSQKIEGKDAAELKESFKIKTLKNCKFLIIKVNLD